MEKNSKKIKNEREKNPRYIKGAFKLFICIKIKDREILTKIKTAAETVKELYKETKGLDMDLVDDLHISLTKNYYTDFKQIKPFVSDIKDIGQEFNPFNLFIDTSDPVFYKSDSGVRYTAFKVVQGNKGERILVELREKIINIITGFNLELVTNDTEDDILKPKDKIMSTKHLEKIESKLKQNKFQFHISFLRTKEKINRKIIKKIIENLNNSLSILTVNEITLRIGDKNYLIKLNQQD